MHNLFDDAFLLVDSLHGALQVVRSLLFCNRAATQSLIVPLCLPKVLAQLHQFRVVLPARGRATRRDIQRLLLRIVELCAQLTELVLLFEHEKLELLADFDAFFGLQAPAEGIQHLPPGRRALVQQCA